MEEEVYTEREEVRGNGGHYLEMEEVSGRGGLYLEREEVKGRRSIPGEGGGEGNEEQTGQEDEHVGQHTLPITQV